MLNKEILIKVAKDAREKKTGIFIVNDNNKIKIFLYKGFCEDFLKKYNYSYDDNLIVGTTADSILKSDNIIYKGYEMNIKNFIEYINEDFKNYTMIYQEG